RHEIFGIARGRIARSLLLHNRHRNFRKVIEHQVINGSAFNLAYRRIYKIAPETLPRGYANLFHVVSLEFKVQSPESRVTILYPPVKPCACVIKRHTSLRTLIRLSLTCNRATPPFSEYVARNESCVPSSRVSDYGRKAGAS